MRGTDGRVAIAFQEVVSQVVDDNEDNIGAVRLLILIRIGTHWLDSEHRKRERCNDIRPENGMQRSQVLTTVFTALRWLHVELANHRVIRVLEQQGNVSAMALFEQICFKVSDLRVAGLRISDFGSAMPYCGVSLIRFES